MRDAYEDVRAAFDRAEDVFADPAGPGHNGPPASIEAPGEAPPVDPFAEAPPELVEECAGFPLNDYGNGKRFVAYFGGDVINVPRVGWFVWDGKHWAQDEDSLKVRRHAQQINILVGREAEVIQLEGWENDLIQLGKDARKDLRDLMEIPASKRSDDQKARIYELETQVEKAEALQKKLAGMRRAHTSHAKATGNSGPITNLMKEAAVDRTKAIADLDADKLMINTGTGAVRFHQAENKVAGRKVWRREVLAHARGLMLSKLMDCDFDPEAECPEFHKFMLSIQPDPAIRDFLQRWFGYTLTGLTTEQKLCFFYGVGRNGKSTLVDLIAKMMGPYAASVPIESLAGSEQRKGSDATPDLVRLPGARMVRASEPEKGQKFREALIKSLTGGEEILIRRMMQEFVQVVPDFKLTISGNYKPEIRGTDEGIWRRVLLVPFPAAISDADADAALPVKLWNERNGILNWLLEGTEKWLNDGLAIPQEVLDATKEYRAQNDPVRVFLENCCVIDGEPDTFTRTKELVEAFTWWAEATGKANGWTTRTVSDHLKTKAETWVSAEGKRFHEHKRSAMGYKGIRLSDEFRALRDEADVEARYADPRA
jgi:putative DNA primase/helicase